MNREQEAIEKIHHSELISYLNNTGWQQESSNEVISTFRKDRRRLDILINQELPTYTFEIGHSLKALAFEENRSLSELIKDISYQKFQVLALSINPGQSDHTLSLMDSPKLREAAIHLVLGSAHAAENNALRIAKIRELPNSYLGLCREDQTKAASYIARFLIPEVKVSSEKGQELNGIDVISKMKSALERCGQLLEKESLPEPSSFGNEASQGINDRFLKGLTILGELNSVSTEARITLSSLRSGDGAELILGSDGAKYFREFYDALDESSRFESYVVEGKITELKIDETSATIGIMKISGKSKEDQTARKYIVTLKDDYFVKAAHEFDRAVTNRDSAFVRVKGTMLKRKRNPQISDVVEFNVLNKKPAV
jgi:hypothetical protein